MNSVRFSAVCALVFPGALVLIPMAAASDFTAEWPDAAHVPLTINGYRFDNEQAAFSIQFAPPAGTVLTVINNTSINPLEGTLTNLGQGQFIGLAHNGVTFHFRADYLGGDGNDLVLVLVAFYNFTAVEPVYDTASGTWGPFPAWGDMRSAWGDYDADGDQDVVLMGAGPSGPAVKLFVNDPGAGVPYAFDDRFTSFFPQLQDGALAWGDMDNDGDLDLAITGTARAVPTGPSDVQLHVLRNNGAAGFSESTSAALFPGCYLGCLSWGDLENDGDLDLFVSGMAWNPQNQRADLPFARIYRNHGDNLDPDQSILLLPDGTSIAVPVGTTLPSAGLHVKGVTWTDIDRDTWSDFILHGAVSYRSGDLEPYLEYEQQVWLNWRGRDWGQGEPDTDARRDLRYRVERSPVARLGEAIEGQTLFLPGTTNGTIRTWRDENRVTNLTELYGTSGAIGGGGDWDGDGGVDLMFPARTSFVIPECQVMRHDPPYGGSLPGFRPIATSGLDRQANTFACAGHTSADLFNQGRQQWLAMEFTPSAESFVGFPEFMVASHDLQWGLLKSPLTGGITGRFRGALDAVDVNHDGRLEIFLTGMDRQLQEGSVLYKHAGSVNTAPSAPTGLTAVEEGLGWKFSWNAGADAETRTEALRYAVSLRKIQPVDKWYLSPGAILPGEPNAGRRLLPGLNGTLHTTSLQFVPLNRNSVSRLPDGEYKWTVQTVDSAGVGSAFAPEQSFTIGDPLNPPPPDSGERSADLPWRSDVLEAGDVDGDGDLDLALAGRPDFGASGATLIRRNDGPHPVQTDSFAFSEITPQLPPLEGGALRWGDVDGDGDLDLAMCGKSLGQPLTRMYHNRGDGVMELRQVLTGVEKGALDWGDFDNDGDLDLVVTGYRDKKPLTRLYQNGGPLNAAGGLLTEIPSTLPDLGNGAAAWGDFDSDGDLDLLLCGDAQPYDQPAPACTAPPYVLRPPNASYMCGNFATGVIPRAQTTIFRNEGLATLGIYAGKWRFVEVFQTPVLPPLISYSGARAVIAKAEWADMTGDGRLDLLLGGMTDLNGQPGFGVPTAKVFLSTGAGVIPGQWTFQEGGELLANYFDHSMQTLTCADWSQDGWPDVLMGGWLNGPGSVPTQVRRGNGGRYFPLTPDYLHTTLPGGEEQFASGPAIYGHFNDDANLDVALAGRWGIVGTGGIGTHGTAGRIFLNLTGVNLRPTPPDTPTANVTGSGTEIEFTWGESSDGLSPVKPTYNLHVARVDGQPGGMPGMADLSTGQRRVARRGNAAHQRTWKLRNLPAGQYRWSVQAIDVALATSAFTTAAQTFTAAPPVAPVINPLPPFHNWVAVNRPPVAVDLLSVSAARNARLVTGRRGRLLLSRNREPFAEVESGVFSDLYDSVITAEGATVVGDEGVILTSVDAVVWQRVPSGRTDSLRAIARGGSAWVAAGNGIVLQSPDRATWTAGTLPSGALVNKVLWAFNRWIAAGTRSGTGLLLASSDGLTWTETTPAGLAAGTITGLATDGTKVVATGGDQAPFRSDVFSSTDGLTWTVQSSGGSPMTGITHTTQGWYAVEAERILGSTDAVAWTPLHTGDGFIRLNFGAVAASDGMLTAAGASGVLFDSPIPATAFTRRGGNTLNTYGNEPYLFASLGSLVVAAGDFGIQHISYDSGKTWQGAAFVVSDAFYGLAAGAGRIVRSFYQGLDHTTDGVTWTRVSIPSPNRLTKGLAFGNGRFVASRAFGGFFVSTTGLTWDQLSITTPQATAMAFGNGRFMALDASGNVRTSVDGASWSAVGTVIATRLHFARDRFFALSGDQVRASTDGVVWSNVTGLPAGVEFTAIAWHRDRYILTGGPDALLLTSPDLAVWTRVPIPASGALRAAFSHADGLFIAGSNQALLFAADVAPATPPAGQVTLTPAGILGPNVFGFTVTGGAGQAVTLERSSNLSQWTAVETFTLAGGSETLEVEIPQPLPSEYFRLRWAP